MKLVLQSVHPAFSIRNTRGFADITCNSYLYIRVCVYTHTYISLILRQWLCTCPDFSYSADAVPEIRMHLPNHMQQFYTRISLYTNIYIYISLSILCYIRALRCLLLLLLLDRLPIWLRTPFVACIRNQPTAGNRRVHQHWRCCCCCCSCLYMLHPEAAP